MKLTFLGGVGTVTGSKYLIETGGKKVLIDCGLFQGYKQLRLRNWATLPVDPSTLDAVVLTHAHIDHSGYLPLLVRNGFSGSVYCTDATHDLCSILLPDSGFLQEKDAERANRNGYTKHQPAKPLYTKKDAESALKKFKSVDFNTDLTVSDELNVRFLPAGHILGAAVVEVTAGATKVVFSGDLGRSNDPIMVDPTAIAEADYLVVESTYGDRLHGDGDPMARIAEIVTSTAARGGTVLIPSFAVGRAQLILFYLNALKAEKRIPDLPVFLDSPMAIDASEMFCRHHRYQRLAADQCRDTCGVARYTRSVDDSKALVENPVPKVIISASGMATGGRVLHHLKHYAPDHRNAILFVGYQAGGTRGATIVAGADSVKIHGQQIPIKAQVASLNMLSAHADSGEIMAWLKNFKSPPRKTFITHGEAAASDALRRQIEGELGWQCEVPEYREEVILE